LQKLGREEEALSALEKSIQIQPKRHGKVALKGWILATLGRYDEALNACNNAIEY
jgi:tetratricopeptide (TPR) repeat protein